MLLSTTNVHKEALQRLEIHLKSETCCRSLNRYSQKYRGISTAYNILALILQDRLVPQVEEMARNYQRGLRNENQTLTRSSPCGKSLRSWQNTASKSHMIA